MNPQSPMQAPAGPGEQVGSAATVRQISVLSGLTRHWLGDMSASFRPQQLCRQHPAVANRVARCWADSDLCVQLLEDLLEGPLDRDGEFSAPVRHELEVLRELRSGRLAQPAGTWVGRMMQQLRPLM